MNEPNASLNPTPATLPSPVSLKQRIGRALANARTVRHTLDVENLDELSFDDLADCDVTLTEIIEDLKLVISSLAGER